MFKIACPILPVRDVERSLELFARLGFKTDAYGEAPAIYGFVERDGVCLHLDLAPNLTPHQNTTAVYLYVDDPDALYREWTAADPAGEFTAPEDKAWGVREMTYVDRDSNLFRIGKLLT